MAKFENSRPILCVRLSRGFSFPRKTINSSTFLFPLILNFAKIILIPIIFRLKNDMHLSQCLTFSTCKFCAKVGKFSSPFYAFVCVEYVSI